MFTFNKYIKYDYIKKNSIDINISNNPTYYNSVEDKENKYIEDIKLLETDKYIDINNIKNKNSLFILKKEYEIINLLNKYCLKNIKYNILLLISGLNNLLLLSDKLKKRLNQKNIVNKKIYNLIFRCSYKFCKYKENCFFIYSNKKCYQDHYVHNMVSFDITMLLNYLNNNIDINIKDVSKSIITLTYVINHMYNELSARCLYCVNDKEKEKNHI
jgi:hypothetical protein